MFKVLFRPTVALMQRLDFKKRIWVIGGVFFLPILFLAFQADKEWRSDINFTRQELKGSECLKPILLLIQHMQQHRAANVSFLSGDWSFKATMQQKQAEVAEDIRAVDAVMEKYGEEFKVKGKWDAIKQEWQNLQSQAEKLSRTESFQRHSELIGKILHLRQDIADASNLSLDTEVDTYYLMSVVVQRLPEAIERLGHLRFNGLVALLDRNVTDKEKLKLDFNYQFALNQLQRASSDLERAMGYNSNLRNRVEPSVRTAMEKANGFLNLLDEQILKASKINLSTQEYFAAATGAMDALFDLAKTLSGELENLLNARIQKLSRKRLFDFAVSFVFVALAFVLLFGFFVATTEGLSKVIANSRQLSEQVFPQLVYALQHFSQGDLTYRLSVSVPELDSENFEGTEEGKLISAAAQLAESAKAMVEAYSSSSGQLTQLVMEISQVANRLGEVSGQMAVATQQVGAAITQIANSVQQSAQGATEQAASISRTQSAFEQFNRAVESIASGAQEQAKLVNDLAKATDKIQQVLKTFTQVVASGVTAVSEAQQVAVSNSQRLRQMLSAMDAIRNAVETARHQVERMNRLMADIGKIVNTIADIAQQTNLLALNAAIEAARAGEQGRGFSVVADEVRKLAERSAQATKEIADLIANVQQGAEESVKAMEATYKQVSESAAAVGEAEQALGNIVEAVRKVQEQSSELELGRKEISEALEQVFMAVQRLSAIAEQNAAATEELAATAADMNEQIRNVAVISEQTSAAMEEVSAASEEVSAQASEMAGNSQQVADMSVQLLSAVRKFKFEQGSQLDFRLIKAQHLRWKTRLRDFLDGKETLTEQQVTSHRHCDLGKWLYSEGMSKYGHLPEMKDLERIHAELHETARRIVQLQRSGQKSAAEREFAKIEPISQRIVQLLDHLENLVSNKAEPAETKKREGDGYTVRELINR